MELGNQQERRLADLQWFAGFFDGEGCLSIVQYKQRRFTQFAVAARLVNSSITGIAESVNFLVSWGLPYHIGYSGPSEIGSKATARISVCGYKRVKRFLDVVGPYLRTKKTDAMIVGAFIESRLNSGPKAPYTEREIDMFLSLRQIHGYRLNESSETLRKTLLERRYSPNSDRKTESAAEMTAPSA